MNRSAGRRVGLRPGSLAPCSPSPGAHAPLLPCSPAQKRRKSLGNTYHAVVGGFTSPFTRVLPGHDTLGSYAGDWLGCFFQRTSHGALRGAANKEPFASQRVKATMWTQVRVIYHDACRYLLLCLVSSQNHHARGNYSHQACADGTAGTTQGVANCWTYCWRP